MSALIRMSAGAIAIGLYCMPLGTAVAQQTTSRNPGEPRSAQAQPDATDPAGRQAQPGRAIPGRQPYTANFRGTQTNNAQAGQEVENFLANCLLKNNQAEVEFGQLAQKQAQNPEVKQFAEQMVKDHQQLVQKLQPIAKAQASTQRNAASSLDANAPDGIDRTKLEATGGRPGSSATDTTIRPAVGGNAALNQLAGIEQKINERCQKAFREELQQKSGAEFDECYLGAQIGGHMHMLAALEVISEDTQGPLKQVAEEARPTVQSHLEHAKQLMAQVKTGGRSATAERTSTSPQPQR